MRLCFRIFTRQALNSIGILLCVAPFVRPAFNAVGAGDAVSENLTPPQPVPAKPPVDLFRSLLLMAPPERREFLSKRSPEAQKLIQAKIKEYEMLDPEARDLRLLVTELRWYLLPLLHTSAPDRTAQLAAVPQQLRDLIAARLQEWDKLPPAVQKELLDNESTVRFYFDLATRTPQQRAETVTNLPPAVHEQLDAGIRRWQALSDDQRQTIVRNFSQFFELTGPEREKAISSLSEPERLQIQNTLNTFAGLTELQRLQCLRSFQKFASLSPEERQQFLKSAERWERMTPSERQSWRNLVSNLSHQPPMPPGFDLPPAPSAPKQGARSLTPVPGSWATNAN